MKRMALFALAGALLLATPAVQAETLTLQDCLRETALHNPSVVEQARGIERAAGTRLTLRSRALPTLTISGLAGYQGQESSLQTLQPVTKAGPVPGMVVPVLDANGNQVYKTVETVRASQYLVIASGALYQPVFDAAIPASWRRGNLENATALENYYAVAVTQMYATRTLFNQALFHRDNGKLLSEIDHTYEANIKTVETLVNAGLTGRQALLQAQIQRANFSTAITSATGSYRTSLTALLASMGREQRTVGGGDLVANVRLEGTLDAAPMHFDPRAAAEQALTHRPDLEALRVLVRSEREDAKITRAGYYPLVRVYVTGDLIPQSSSRSDRPNQLREGDDVRTTEIRPGARYDWAALDFGAVRGAAQEIDRTREAVEINLHRLEQNVTGDLSQLRAAAQSAAATIQALRDNLVAAQDTLNIVTGAVAQGTGSQLEFDNAQTGLLTTRGSLLQAQLQASNSRAEYDRVTGGYLRFVTADEGRKHEPDTGSVK